MYQKQLNKDILKSGRVSFVNSVEKSRESTDRQKDKELTQYSDQNSQEDVRSSVLKNVIFGMKKAQSGYYRDYFDGKEKFKQYQQHMKRLNHFVQYKQENPYSDKDLEFEMIPSPKMHNTQLGGNFFTRSRRLSRQGSSRSVQELQHQTSESDSNFNNSPKSSFSDRNPVIIDPFHQTSRSDRIKMKHYMLNNERMKKKNEVMRMQPVVAEGDMMVVQKAVLKNANPYTKNSPSHSSVTKSHGSRNLLKCENDNSIQLLRQTNYGSFDKLKELFEDCHKNKAHSHAEEFVKNFHFLNKLQRQNLRRDKPKFYLKIEKELYPLASKIKQNPYSVN